LQTALLRLAEPTGTSPLAAAAQGGGEALARSAAAHLSGQAIAVDGGFITVRPLVK
jgi:hypothetical protein